MSNCWNLRKNDRGGWNIWIVESEPNENLDKDRASTVKRKSMD
jgi:hypothetical protein